MNRLLGWLGMMVLITGCGSISGPHQETNSPRVVGRVLDEASRQPIAGATVRKVEYGESPADYSTRRGGPQLKAKAVVWTDPEGRFVLGSSKSFYLIFGHGGWSTAEILIEHPQYLAFKTNLLHMSVNTNAQKGPLEILAGDILLSPKAK